MFNELAILNTIAQELWRADLDELPGEVQAAMLFAMRAGQKTALLNVSAALAKHARN